jgi:uncharacterized delta-60 repeat protein
MTTANRLRTSLTLALLACLLALLFATSAVAAAVMPGSLDPSFGDNGRVIGEAEKSAAGGTAYWERLEVDAAIAPDGSVYTLDAGWLRHYLADGSLDTAFGNGGRLAPEDPEGMPFRASGIASDPSGRVLVFGTSDGPTNLIFLDAYGHHYATVLRYAASGQLDPTLGRDGSVLLNSEQGLGSFEAFGSGGAVDPLGRIVLVVAERENVQPRGTVIADHELVRLDESGGLDKGFSGNGIAPLSGVGGRVTGLAFSPDGAVTIGGEARTAEEEFQPQVKRLAADGSLDTSFRVDARLIPTNELHQGAPSVLIARDGRGRTILAGSDDTNVKRKYTQVSVVRLLGSGKRDHSFAGGEAKLRLKGRYEFSQVLVAGGKILLVGRSFGRKSHLTPRIAIVRLLGSGRVDLSFGNRGIVTTRFGNPPAAVTPTDAAVSQRNRLLVAGAVTWPELSGGGAPALFAYRLD